MGWPMGFRRLEIPRGVPVRGNREQDMAIARGTPLETRDLRYEFHE